MYATLIKVFASILAFLIGFLNISVDLPGFSDDKVSITTIDYLNDDAGSADAVISITTTTDGEYKLYWADENFEKLTFSLGENEIEFSEFATVNTYFGEVSIDLPDYTAIPYGAENILVTLDGETLEIYEIPAEKLPSRGEKVYSFGSISDLHFNRYELEGGADVAESTFARALTFFDNADVSLVAMPGDISTEGEKEAFMAFNRISAVAL